MLCLNLGNRITAEVAPNHPYFNGCESGISIFTRILPQSWYPNHCRSSSESSIFQRVCESGIDIFTHAHCLNLGIRITAEAALNHPYFNGFNSIFRTIYSIYYYGNSIT